MTTATAVEDLSYTDLYKRWERSNWSAHEIDFSEDRRHWREELTEHQRRAAMWTYSLFLHGEEVVAETLGPFIDAAPRPEQKHFLATQQVDEARHTVFFARFIDEVLERDGGVAGTLSLTDPQLSHGFRRLFGLLDRTAAELRRKPTLPRLAAGVTLYHILIEASLAQPGQRFLESFLEDSGLLPGLYQGVLNVANDEQRHIGFGVKLLADLLAEDPACKDAVEAMLRQAMPWTLSVFIPPGWDESYLSAFGSTMLDQYEFAQRSFEAKLTAAGLPPEELDGAVPWSSAMTPRERAERTLVLMRANMLGTKFGPASREPAAVEAMFDTVRLAVDHRHAPDEPVTLEWEFTDMEPWHLVVDNGSTHVAAGRAPKADVRLRCAFDDWVDIVAGRRDPRRSMLAGKVRPRGDVRMLLKTSRLFG